MFEKLFESSGFEKDQTIDHNQINIFKRAGSQFYFVAEYTQEEFINYDESEITEEVINIYTKKREGNPLVSKNSSLVLLVKCKDYIQSQEILNKVYKIEEDAFGMRKYAIVAQADIINWIKNISLEELKNVALSKERFNNYQEKGLSNDDHEYMGAIQVFIKLPFLSIEESRSELQTISEMTETLVQKGSYKVLMEQNLGERGEIFNDREDFLSMALSLEKNKLDTWLDVCLEGNKP